MKKVLVTALFLASAPLAFAAGKGEVIAAGKIELDKSLTDKAKGIRTLFISIMDPQSPMPRPYAATKVDLPKDASGAFHEFKLTQDNLMVMGQGPVPKNFKIKVKLDKDGSAGMDAAGDLFGTADSVKLGAENVVIKVDKAVN